MGNMAVSSQVNLFCVPKNPTETQDMWWYTDYHAVFSNFSNPITMFAISTMTQEHAEMVKIFWAISLN